MIRREAVARAIHSADSSDVWMLLTPREQAGYFALADAALKAVDEVSVLDKQAMEGFAEEEDESDKAQDFYELNGLR